MNTFMGFFFFWHQVVFIVILFLGMLLCFYVINNVDSVSPKKQYTFSFTKKTIYIFLCLQLLVLGYSLETLVSACFGKI